MMAGMNPGMAQPAADKDDGKLVNLSSAIDKADCFARNVAPGFPMTNLFIGDSRLGCKSDADEQLILHISFHDFVRVRRVVQHAVVVAFVPFVPLCTGRSAFGGCIVGCAANDCSVRLQMANAVPSTSSSPAHLFSSAVFQTMRCKYNMM
mmetsp:Transcript_2620/g.7256  ORF Transcript_2620/g.7256 Transcript_2620/m.7256 type:complete len:150 (-) Transcript_2620:1373-1822(-)